MKNKILIYPLLAMVFEYIITSSFNVKNIYKHLKNNNMKSLINPLCLVIFTVVTFSFNKSEAQTVKTLNPANITSTSAVLQGIVNPKDKKDGTAYFLSSFGKIPALPSTLSGNSDIPVSAIVTGLTPNTEYTYLLEYANISGGLGIFCDGDEVTFTTYSTSIYDPINLAEFKIFPNPASDVIYFKSNINIQKIEISNLLGRIILTKIPDQNFKNEININGLAKGLYLVKVIANNQSKTERLLIR